MKEIGQQNIFNNSYENIKSYFDELNQNKDHFTNSNDICTPIDCVKEMVDSVPNNFWQKDIKVLDSCCGNGNFHAYINTKTELSNLYFNEINLKRVDNLITYFGEDINLTTKDFLEFEDKEQYDMVVSNPPYAKFNNNKRVSKNHNLSRDFIKKALTITKKDGYILFVVPNNWMSFSDRNTLPKELSNYQFIYLDIGGAKKYFPKVGSSFTWFLLKKSPNKKEFIVKNHYKLKDEVKVKLKINSDFIPLYYSEIVKSILDKTIYNNNIEKYKIETTSFLHRYTKKDLISDIKTNKYKYKIIHTPSTTLWSEIPHKYQDGYKVFLSLTNQYGLFIDDCGMTQSIAFIRCQTKKEAEKIKQELENPIYKFLNNITRYGNFNNIRVLQKLPKWGKLNLTSKELEFIEYFNNIYYGKKEK
jgi:SAM-dependent methyltransferase